MTTTRYVIAIALGLAITAVGLLLGWVQDLRWKLRRRQRFLKLVVASLKDGGGPLCDTCRAEFIARLDRQA